MVAFNCIFAAGKYLPEQDRMPFRGVMVLIRRWPVVVTISMRTKFVLAIPPVLLTVLGTHSLIENDVDFDFFVFRYDPRFRHLLSRDERVSIPSFPPSHPYQRRLCTLESSTLLTLLLQL